MEVLVLLNTYARGEQQYMRSELVRAHTLKWIA